MMDHDAERDAIAEREELEALARAIQAQDQASGMERAGQRHQRLGMGGMNYQKSSDGGQDFAAAFRAHHAFADTFKATPAQTIQKPLFSKEA